MTADLVGWLRAQVDTDEETARYAGGTGRWAVGECVEAPEDPMTTEWQVVEDRYPVARVRGNTRANHIGRWDPARVLAEVESKRRILDDAARVIIGFTSEDAKELAWDTIKVLALPYADRPGYQEGWRP